MIGILALVGALSMLQSGQIDIGALTAKAEPVASDSKKGKKSKPPVLFPRQETAVVPAVPADAQLDAAAITRRQPRRELYQALPRMDGEAAAKMLAEIDDELVTEMLLELRERELALILEAAPPIDAGRWVTNLLEAAPQLELPGELAALAIDGAAASPLAEADSAQPDDMSTDDSAATADGSTGQPADPIEQPGNNGAAADPEFPRQPPDTNTA